MTLNTWFAGEKAARGSVPDWTGRLKFGLFNGRSWPIGDAEVVVRMDTVTLHLADRVLAVMDRPFVVAIERRDDLDLSTRPATVTRTPMEICVDGRRMSLETGRALVGLLAEAVRKIETAAYQ